MNPPIAFIIPTYNRSKIVFDAITALHKFIVYDGDLHVYIGVDGADDTLEHLSDLDFTLGKGIELRSLYMSTFLGPRRLGLPKSECGLGANLNMLLREAMEDGMKLFFQMDDDHMLKEPIDLNRHVEKLLSDESAGWIRLMNIAGHKYEATLDGSYWQIHWDSPELYIPSNRPHLKHIRFMSTFGFYPIGKTLGQTEEGYCHQCKDIAKAFKYKVPNVLVPLGVRTEDLWDHVGDSWQRKGE